MLEAQALGNETRQTILDIRNESAAAIYCYHSNDRAFDDSLHYYSLPPLVTEFCACYSILIGCQVRNQASESS